MIPELHQRFADSTVEYCCPECSTHLRGDKEYVLNTGINGGLAAVIVMDYEHPWKCCPVCGQELEWEKVKQPSFTCVVKDLSRGG